MLVIIRCKNLKNLLPLAASVKVYITILILIKLKYPTLLIL